jgi:hypothetical protein
LQALSILFGALFTVAASLGCGALVLREHGRDPGIRFVTGAAVLSLVVFALCCLHAAYPLVFLAVGASAIAAGWRPAMQVKWPAVPRILLLFFIVFSILYFFSSMAPETSPDGAAYHLGFTGHYFRWHGFQPVPWNLYGMLSQGMEMLFLFAYAFGRHSAAAMVHYCFLLALAWQMFAWARGAGLPLAGACGALLVYASPIVGIDATSAYNDVAVAAIAFTLFHLLQRWDAERAPRLLLAIGTVAGFGFAVKYTAWAGVAYALVFVAWKSRRIGALVRVATAAVLVAGPWLLRNWIWYENPLAPFYNHLFPNPYITPFFEAGYRHDLQLYELHSRWQIPMEVTVRGGLTGVIGPVFLLAPVALFALRRREGRQLLLAGAVFGAGYFSNIGARFLIPAMPFVALAMTLALSFVPMLPVAIAVVHAVLSWPPMIEHYTVAHSWHLLKVPYREALRIKSQGEYLRSHLVWNDEERLIEEKTAPQSTVFMYRPIPEAYTSRRLLVGWQSASNQIAGLILQTAADPQLQPTWRLRFRFARQELRGVRLVQSTAAGDLWNIHELRLYDGDRELPRAPEWRLTADPSPWGIQEAFDNSPVTMWRSGESLSPGASVSVEFHRAEQADGVIMEAASNQQGLRLKLEGRDASGVWRELAAAPQIYDAAPPLGMKREATQELKRRGIEYVLAFNDERETEELRRNPAAWGLVEVGQTKEARLFQIP